MSAYFSSITLDNYKQFAFGTDASGKPDPNFKGGLYAGKDTQWRRPERLETAAEARLITVNQGKLFVRWYNTSAPKDPPHLPAGWSHGGLGVWWSSDRMADIIVRRTIKALGVDGDSSIAARQYSAVAYDWSDMKRVIVCKLTQPIKILIGVGRPVVTRDPETERIVLFKDSELQCVILTQYLDDTSKRVFHAHTFMRVVHDCTSKDFTKWWSQQSLKDRRLAP